MPRFTLLAAVAIALLAPGNASAAPANDFFAQATEIASLPFSETIDLAGAGTEFGEPQFCNFQSQTVWYRLTTPTPLRIDLSGSSFGVVLNVYRSFGGGIGSLSFHTCLGFGGSTQLLPEPGVTYYVQAGSVSLGPAMLSLNVQPVPPPANDDFAAATPIHALPYVEFVDLTAATLEPGEPVSPPGGGLPLAASAWYSFTPAASGSYALTTLGCCATTYLTPYRGDAVGDLSPVEAFTMFGRTLFNAAAGTTYRIQLGRGPLLGGTVSGGVRLERTPPIAPAFSWNPIDPSTFEDVTFSNQSSDPVVPGTFKPADWELGDGSTATGGTVSHRFAADGDYDVTMNVETVDGRTGTLTRTVQVRTHDVAISKLTVPQSAAAGQTREITIGLANTRYPELATIVLLKGLPLGGERFIGSTTQTVQVRTGGRTTSVSLPYTFTDEDATLGKVTFKVRVSLQGARDALPADNEATALPTRVR